MSRVSSHEVRHPVFWVPTAYIAEGVPFAMVIWVAGTMFKDLGHRDSEITVAVASIGIVWSLKPLWAGFLDMFRTKKFFVLSMELVIAALFVAMALALQLESYFFVIVGVMWVVAFASATQDICVDGVYITALDERRQAAFIGVQGMAWNLGRIIAVSATVWLAGYLQTSKGVDSKTAWGTVLGLSGLLMAALGLYHMAFLPAGAVPEERQGKRMSDVIKEFLTSAADFCDKPSLWGMLAFVFFFRSAEGLLLVEAPLFMQSCLEAGGLQLSLQDKGAIDGTISTVVLIAGGLLGGLFISRFTLKRTLFVLALCVNVPNACYVYLAHAVSPENPLSFREIAFVVSLEKFWYGFGFVGNMLYMMQQLAPGRFKMTHYAFATALMNLVLVPTQMASGPLADLLGFREYFWLVMFAAIPSLLAAWFAPFPQSSRGGVVDPLRGAETGEGPIRRTARRATVFAMLAVALFLYVDVLVVGWMSRADDGYLLVFLMALIVGSFALKVGLGVKAIRAGRDTLALAARSGAGGSFVGNGRGAMVGGLVVVVLSVAVGAYGVQRARSTDWSCAFSNGSSGCRAVEAAPPTGCRVPSIRR